MQRYILILLLSLSPLLAKGQEPAFNYKALETKIRKMLSTSPDSTKVLIDYALAQKTLPDSLRGNTYNLYGIYYGNIGRQDSAIYYYKKAITALKNYPNIKSRPLTNISVIYRNMGEYNLSFACLNEALEITRKYKNRPAEANILSNMSSNYQFMQEYDKAVTYVLQGIEILKKESNKDYLPVLYQKLANTYMKMRNFNFAKDIYLECLKMMKAKNDEINYAYTLINYAECVLHMSESGKAKKALKEAIVILRKFNDEKHIGIAYSKIANISFFENKHDVSFRNYQAALKALAKSNSLEVVIIAAEYVEALNKTKNYKEAAIVIENTKKTPIYKHVNSQDKLRLDVAAAETYKNSENDTQALINITNAVRVKDSLSKIDPTLRTKELQAQFQKELQHEKAQTLKARNNTLQKAMEAKNKLTLLYILSSIAITITVLMFLRSYWLKNRLQKEALKSVEAEKSLIEQQHLYELELADTQRQTIEDKQKELASSALRIASYQDNINEIIEKCDTATKVDDIKSELKNLIQQRDYWKQFEARFSNLHPEFESTLVSRFSKLTKNDLEFCTLLKLNLSNKEIASLLQISHESTITKKYRIKKKMELDDDLEFEQILREI